jgi:long-chain-fatty-acid--CoA ligase ACSBG
MSISGEGLNHILANLDHNNPSRNFLWTTDYKVELPVRVKKHGPGS